MRKPNNKKIFLVLGCCFALFALSFSFASAYKLLEPVPLPLVQGSGYTDVPPTSAGLTGYLKYIFSFALAAAAFLAMAQITIAGAQWIASGASVTSVESAKGRITDAITGLILAFGSYLILYTINPDLVNMRLDLQPIAQPTVATDGIVHQWAILNWAYTTCNESILNSVDDNWTTAANESLCDPASKPDYSYYLGIFAGTPTCCEHPPFLRDASVTW